MQKLQWVTKLFFDAGKRCSPTQPLCTQTLSKGTGGGAGTASPYGGGYFPWKDESFSTKELFVSENKSLLNLSSLQRDPAFLT